jgi:hypothetical protein
MSPTWWLSQHAEWTGMNAANLALPGWANANAAMHADVLGTVNRYTSNFGVIGTDTTGETQSHSIYSLYRLMQYIPNMRTVANDSDHLDPDAISAGATRQIDATIPDITDRYQDMVDTILLTIGPPDTIVEYCTVAEVEAMIPQWPKTTWPPTLNAAEEIVAINAEVNMVLANHDMTVPFVSDGTAVQALFFDYLKMVCRNGVAWRVVRSLFPEATGAGETPAWADFKSKFKDGLKGLSSGDMIPQTLDIVPTSPSTLDDTHGSEEVNPSLGTHHKHAFYRNMSDKF